MIGAAVSSPLQVLDRGSVRPLLIAPSIRKNYVLVTVTAFAILLVEEL
jgi:hypothetical protein